LITFNIDGAIQSGIAAAQGRKTWGGHDRNTSVGSSEIGGCSRRIWYTKHGVAPDPNFTQDLGAAERGNAIEDWMVLRIQDALKHDPTYADWDLLHAGPDQMTLVDTPQSATPDGILVHKPTGQAINLEIKSQDPRIYETSIAAQPAHKIQVIQSMGLVRRRTKYQPESGILIYVNTSFVTQYRPYVVPYVDAGYQALRKRAGDIMNGAYSAAKPPPAEGIAEGGKECEYCPWREQCTLREIGRLPTDVRVVPAAVAKKLHELATVRKELLTRRQTAETSQKTVEAEIVGIMEQHETKRIAGDWGSLSIYKAHSPPVADREKLAAEVGEDRVAEFFRQGTPYIRINVALK
jgi:CRISPR/Cas system-associated exonuclease Cas4 (RecB family)